MDFERQTMLLRLSIGQWTAKKTDKAATVAVQSQFNASPESGAFQKVLIGAEYTDPISKATSALRGWHSSNSLPWLYDGWRIIPTRHHADYMAGYRPLKLSFSTAVGGFLGAYGTAKIRAETSLGALYNPLEYPGADILQSKFYCSLDPQPFPSITDWRTDLAAGEMTIIREKAEQSVKAGLIAAQSDAWERLRVSLASMANKLKMVHGETGPDGKALKNSDGDTAIFRDGRIDSFRELLDTLPGLNLFGDPDLDAIIQETRDRLGGLTAEGLRADTVGRIMAAGAADDILERMAGFTGGGALSINTEGRGGRLWIP